MNPLSEAMRKAMAVKPTRLAQKIAALQHLVAERSTTCRSWSYRRQFGNFLTGLYTLCDAVRTFIHALRTFFLLSGKQLAKREAVFGKSCTEQ